MNWPVLGIIIYVAILLMVCLHILIATQHANKALAYILFAVSVPVIGIGFYLTFGINYWRKKKVQ